MGRYVNFNEEGYIKALQVEVSKALDRVSKDVMRALLANFGALTVREIDRKYLAAMRQSIRVATNHTFKDFMTSFQAGHESQPNQSFRVVYYEYGTGTSMKPPSWYSFNDDPYKNPARKDKRIWQRPRGEWVDAGGNKHFSRTKGAPKPLSTKTEYGRPIQAQFWFQRGFYEGTVNLDKYLLEAVKSVPITSYISIAKIYKRL